MERVDPGAIRAAAGACWTSIGVRGDKSCAALPEHAHCRNCPTYSATAAILLEREATAEFLKDATALYARSSEVERPKDRSAILFRIGSELFALPTASLDEVIEPRPIHRLPHRRSAVVLGVTNVRGELVVCASLAGLLGIPEEGTGPTRRLMVLRSTTGRLAVPVDEVQHTHRYHDGELMPVPVTVARSGTSYTQGVLPWGDRKVSSLDAARLLDALDRSLV